MALPWLLWVVVRLLSLEDGYPLVPAMAFTPYVAIAAVAPVAVALLLRQWQAAVAAGLAGLLLAGLVFPRVTGGAEEPEPGDVAINVVSANIYRGDADLDALMELIRETDADILCVQELANDAVPRLDAEGLRDLMPYRVRVPGVEFGGGVFSRFPLRPLEPIVTEPRLERNGRLLSMPRALVRVPGAKRVEVVSAHPFAPTRNGIDAWAAGLDAFPAADDGPPRLLIGDFNATLDHDVFRALIGRGYRDAGEVTGEGLKPTWHADRVNPPPVTIDHVLADKRIGIGDYEVHDLPGSDHEALSATLFVPGAGG